MENRVKKKIIILVLSSNKYPSPSNELAQFNTWGKDTSEYDIELIFYKGGESFQKLENYIIFPTGDSLYDIGYKTIEAFKWINTRYEYEFILRANSSCFINLANLEKFYSEIENKIPIYAGHMNNYKNEFEYVQGVGIMLNKKSVELVLGNEHLWDHNLIDDVALGKIANHLNFKKYSVDSLHVDGKILKGNLDKNYIVYRCKMENFGFPRYLDKHFLHLIDNFFNNEINQTTLFFKRVVFNIIKLFNFKYYKMKYLKRVYLKLLSFIPNTLKNIIKKIIN